MRQHLHEGHDKLPLIINLCIYGGIDSSYPYSQDLYDCFEEVELAKRWMFKSFELIDLTILSQEELLRDGKFGLVEALLKQGIKRDHLNWIRHNPVLICKLMEEPYAITAMIYIMGTDDVSEPEELIKAIKQTVPDKEDIIMSAAHKLQQEAKTEGKIEIAKSLLAKGMDITFIQEVTGLSQQEIKNI